MGFSRTEALLQTYFSSMVLSMGLIMNAATVHSPRTDCPTRK